MPVPVTEKEIPAEKSPLHPRNPHRERYDFKLLTESYPALAPFVQMNPHNEASIDFANPEAVKNLNKALLQQYYGISNWDIPPGYLCPPIPGRADYIHHIADLLRTSNAGKIPTGKKIKCLDIGVGASCVYPIIGNKAYHWSFIGTDIDPISIESANKIIASNTFLKENVVCRLQKNAASIFDGILQSGEIIDLVICNPPFHASQEAAQFGNLRKLNHLNTEKTKQPTLNFGGQNTELWCAGGEAGFVGKMIQESKRYATSCFWFSSLISKQSNLKIVYSALEKAGAADVHTISMGQGNKISRIVAWTFLTQAQQKGWRDTRWR